jgi:HlyD family secretion protein
MKPPKKKLLTGAAVLILVALVVWIWWPKPVPVDLVQVQKGVLTVTVDEQGKTRARDRYVVASPVTGRLTRLEWREGDRVRQGQVVAWLHPSPLDHENWPKSRPEFR